MLQKLMAPDIAPILAGSLAFVLSVTLMLPASLQRLARQCFSAAKSGGKDALRFLGMIRRYASLAKHEGAVAPNGRNASSPTNPTNPSSVNTNRNLSRSGTYRRPPVVAFIDDESSLTTGEVLSLLCRRIMYLALTLNAILFVFAFLSSRTPIVFQEKGQVAFSSLFQNLPAFFTVLSLLCVFAWPLVYLGEWVHGIPADRRLRDRLKPLARRILAFLCVVLLYVLVVVVAVLIELGPRKQPGTPPGLVLVALILGGIITFATIGVFLGAFVLPETVSDLSIILYGGIMAAASSLAALAFVVVGGAFTVLAWIGRLVWAVFGRRTVTP